ncbi:hypothetical protein R1flu_021144 [Riccia fluitans]|uniref:Probable quinone oxidoreductase n=1 Tax=Riccia fluitans TaxID=41844 RepID=A0ABD1ZQI2_9MARC
MPPFSTGFKTMQHLRSHNAFVRQVSATAGLGLSCSAIRFSSSSESQAPHLKLPFQRIFAQISKDEDTGARSGAKMVKAKAFKVHKVGGPEVLQWEDVEVGEPGEGQVRIRQTAVGLNFIDIYFREGIYTHPTPFTPGMEAVGVVTAVGPGLTGRQVGDRVAYAGILGAYAEERLVAADRVVPVPSNIDDITAAAALLKAGTAQFLLRRLGKVERGVKILVHAAAGGVGSLLCQWGNALGATVIGVVSTEAKAAQAKEDGAHHVLIQSEGDFAEKVKEITNGEGVDIVYDSVGKDTLQQSLECLRRRGLMVCFGQSSGLPDPIPLGALAKKSLFLTRPSLMDYTSTRDELLECAGEVFTALAAGIIKVRVNQTYQLAQAAQAQKDLKERKTTGSTVLIVDSAEKTTGMA